MRKIILLVVVVFVAAMLSFSQSVSDPCRKSTEGTDFWFGFMESRNYNNNHYVEVTVTAREATTFKISIGPAGSLFGNYTVSANSFVPVRIPWTMVEAIGSETIQDKGIHLVSEKPVNVYALNWDTNSADVAVIYPLGSLGNEYFAMCYYPDIDTNNPFTGNGRNSEFLIVAIQDSTKVKIKPSKVTDKLMPKDSTFIVYLNKGQIYQVQSENLIGTSSKGQGDLTGSHVISDKPIAFFSGSLSTRIPVGKCCWDHLYEQIPPLHSWGREYYVVPLKSREQDRYRIMAAENNTTVYITGRPPINLNRGEFEEIVLFHYEPKRIFADKPIMVAQFSQSRDVDNTYTAGNGDPFMIILSSISQSKNDVTFVAYSSTNIKKYYVNIITQTDQVSNIRFNGNPMANEFVTFPEGKYSYAQKEISQGNHRIQNIDNNRGFLAYVYGYGGVESYGYGVGFNLDLVLDLGESINFHGDTLLLCHGDSRTLDAGPYFDTYKWNTGDSTQRLTVTKGGKYYVKTTTIDGCVLEDSIFIFVSHPKVELGIEYDEGCYPYSIQLNGNNGFDKYQWQNQSGSILSTSQIITANTTGEYRITVFDKYNCVARDTMNLVVFPVPELEISGNSLICGEKTSQLAVSITNAPTPVWDYSGSFTWATNKTGTLTFSEKTHTSVKFDVTEWGGYQVYYHLKTIDGCETSDTFQVAFHPTPTSDYFIDDNEECKGYNRIVTYTGNASENANYYWDYGGSKLIETIAWDKFVVSIGAFSSKPFLKLFVEEFGCWSDTTIKPIGANPDFVLETEKARGCDSMTVFFKGELRKADSLSFEWDFGDGSPIVTLQNSKHHYSKTGFYDVSLTIKNLLTGCQIGFQIDSMIKVFPTPVAAISGDPGFCYPDSANIFYPHNLDSSICYWEFDGMHQSGPGNDSISVILDQPAGTVRLKVDEFGCFSKTVEKKLKRKPHFDFYTEHEEGCQPYYLEIKAERLDSFLNFEWITDSLPYPTGGSNYFLYPDSGKFDVGLIATSAETGCFDTLVKTDWIWVHPKPTAAFEVDYPVALIENANITYTNFSENAVSFLWDFGDEEFSAEPNPMHTFLELGEYTSQLFVESEFGCRDTSDFLIKILPFTVFTPNAFRPDSPIDENRTFMPLGEGADFSRFYLKIYDRWGQIVFETRTPENPWDGTTKNGSLAPMGNYIWISNYFDIQGYEHNQKGQVLLIR